jgi:glycosyltransferase involved in cell wall biosynthesis
MVTVAVDATPLLGRPTGVGVAVRGLLRSLDGAGLDVVGFGQTGTGWRRLPALLPDRVRGSRGPMPAAVLQRLWARVDVPPLQWWTGHLDVAHGTNFVVPPAGRAARLVTVHDLTPVRYPELCTAAALRYPDLVRRALRRGAVVHTSSAFVAAEVAAHFDVDADRIHVVPWGVDVPDQPGRDTRGSTGRPYILGLGTVEPRKDFPLLVRAFDRIAGSQPDLELRIAGPEGWAEDALRAAVVASPYAGRIRRVGWLADPTDLIAGAAVFAYPSVYEGFGLPPLEAMALGVPVVATAVGAVPEVVGDAADLVVGGDVDGLAGALLRALDDDAHRHRLVAAGRARVARFTWTDAGRRMADLYRALASGVADRPAASP